MDNTTTIPPEATTSSPGRRFRDIGVGIFAYTLALYLAIKIVVTVLGVVLEIYLELGVALPLLTAQALNTAQFLSHYGLVAVFTAGPLLGFIYAVLGPYPQWRRYFTSATGTIIILGTITILYAISFPTLHR